MTKTALIYDRYWKYIVLLVFTASIVIKGYPFIAHPRLWAEEGVIYLKSAIEFGWKSMFLPQLGYYNSIPSLTFYLSTLIHPRLIPYLSEAISALFWYILLVSIINLPRKNYNALFKICLAISVFSVIFGKTEVFLNTINLQFISPAIVLCIYLSNDCSSSNARKILDNFLLILCLFNGILSFFIFPFALYKDSKRKDYVRISIWFVALFVHLYLILSFSGNSSIGWRLTKNLNLTLQEWDSGIIGFFYNRIYWFILIGLFVGIIKLPKYSEYKLSLLILAVSLFGLTIFLECTKQPHETFLHSRYLVLVYTLIIFNLFLYFNEIKYSKNIIILSTSLLFLGLNYRKIFAADICLECPSWDTQYPNIYLKNSDVQFHPLYKNKKPWSFKNNPYILKDDL